MTLTGLATLSGRLRKLTYINLSGCEAADRVGTLLRHEKSCRKRISNIFVTKKHGSNLQDAVLSRKKLLQKNFRPFRDEKTRINLQEVFVSLQKAAAKKFQTFACRKNVNQICRTPFRHEKSRRKKIQAFASRKNVNQICRTLLRHKKSCRKKISNICEITKTRINLQEAVSS
jgi:hypothetical protein